MWLSVGVVAVVMACVGQSVGRVLTHSLRPIQPLIRENDIDKTQSPDVPDYIYNNEFDYSADAQEQLLQDHQDAEVTPGFFQGDMAGLGPQYQAHIRVGLKWEVFPERRWDNATVPYVISPLYLPHEWKVIDTAIATLNFMTCIKFVPWDGIERDYLLIWPMKDPAGCWSFVGKRGGQQIVSLQQPDRVSDRCLGTVGKPIHELLHALGIFHEQARSDRDDHVTILDKNIISDYLHNFEKQSEANTTFIFDYDYNSVMHYGSHFFSYARGRPTIVPKVKGARIGQRLMLSKTDCLKVNHLYGCLDGDSFERDKYTAICNFLGL